MWKDERIDNTIFKRKKSPLLIVLTSSSVVKIMSGIEMWRGCDERTRPLTYGRLPRKLNKPRITCSTNSLHSRNSQESTRSRQVHTCTSALFGTPVTRSTLRSIPFALWPKTEAIPRMHRACCVPFVPDIIAAIVNNTNTQCECLCGCIHWLTHFKHPHIYHIQ